MAMHPLGEPALRLVEGPAPSAGWHPAPLRAPRRPGERHEPVRIATEPAVLQLARTAAGLGVELDLAVTVVLERDLAERRLQRALGPASGAIVAALDRRAGSAKVEGAVSDASAAYVRALLDRRPRPAPALGGEALLVALPMRLAGVVEPGDPAEAARRVDLAGAVRWELAAAIAGLTIGEWAAWGALLERGASR
jgi:hypothetical protein